MSEEVLFYSTDNGLATIYLNRPKALNSLSFTMVKKIRQQLNEWSTNPNVKAVLMKSAGDRAFCAGGDIKSLYEAKNGIVELQQTNDFFAAEYAMDLEVAQFPKPIIAYLDGIVMGGGVGLSYGANVKIVTERTRWAMPEMTIGFFPDVGASYFLNKAPGFIGRYLALTGTQVNAADVLYINGATHFISHEKSNSFFSALENTQVDHKEIESLLEEYKSTTTEKGKLASLQDEIDSHFNHSTVEAIIQSLDNSTTAFATETKETMLSKSPVSLKVTLKQMIAAEQQPLEKCLATDLILAKNFMQHEDLFEGIRSVVIDKDLKPQYKYKTLASVSDEFVDSFFITK